MIKVIWILVSINIMALITCAIYFLLDSGSRNVDSMEKGWTIILAGISVLVILLGILPMRISQSSFSLFISAFFAGLPSIIFIGVFVNNKLPSFRKEQTNAQFYYKDKTQRAIATAIEKNDTLALKELIKGQDLNIQGNKIWDADGLNYLQFAVRLRSSNNYVLNTRTNISIIEILVEAGSATTPVLAEAVRYLPPETISLLLSTGANPNVHGYTSSDPLLFEAINTTKQQNDNAILLIKKGADVNATNRDDLTPAMYAAQNASTTTVWADAWRVVLFMLEEANADYTHTTSFGKNLGSIVTDIRAKASNEMVTMPRDFVKIVEWLQQHNIDTEPKQHSQI